MPHLILQILIYLNILSLKLPCVQINTSGEVAVCYNMQGSRPLQRVDIDDDIKAKLVQRNILTVQDIMTCTKIDLIEVLDAPLSVVQELVNTVSRSTAPKPKTVCFLS